MPAYSYFTKATGVERAGRCGQGAEWQANVMTATTPIELFKVTSDDYARWPDLAALATGINAKLRLTVAPLLQMKQDQDGDPTIEVTVRIANDGLHLVYAKPVAAAGSNPGFPPA